MNQLHSGYTAPRSLRPHQQRKLQLGDDPDNFFTAENMDTEITDLLADCELLGGVLSHQPMQSTVRNHSLFPSFDKVKTSTGFWSELDIVPDDDWMDTLYLEEESDEIFSDSTIQLSIAENAMELDEDPIPATVSPLQRIPRGKDISKQQERLGQDPDGTPPKPMDVPSSHTTISSDADSPKRKLGTQNDLKVADIMLSFKKRSRKAPKIFSPEEYLKPVKKRTSRMSSKASAKKPMRKPRTSKKSMKPSFMKVKACVKANDSAKSSDIEVEKLPDTCCRHIHDSQVEQWAQKFRELLDFKKQYGHASVPHWFEPNMQLSRWVKRQRYQFKLRKAGKGCTLTDERIEALKRAGFVWDSHSNVWEERFNELCEFKKKHGHCSITFDKHRTSNRALASWVKHQRRQHKLAKLGEPSHMTPERIAKLERIGFQWSVKHGRKPVSEHSVVGV